MECRSTRLPFLPGYGDSSIIKPSGNRNSFGRNPCFASVDGIRLLVDKINPHLPGKINERYPSIYTRGEVSDMPSWLAFDNQVLVFDAYAQETLNESPMSPIILRTYKIYFYLEDGTIKITGKQTPNSGIMMQGIMLTRMRVNLPPPKDDLFYDIIDFNIGKEVEIYSRVYKIVNCDQFTRFFLNRLGIAVPDPIPIPEDPYVVERAKKSKTYAKRPNVVSYHKIAKMFANDRKVLRFYGYWDDRNTEYGTIHDLIIHYYLTDDTIDILEQHSDQNKRSLFIKRGKIPKFYKGIERPGFQEDTSILNVLKQRIKLDILNAGRNTTEYYSPTDLVFGAAINVYGRKVVLVDSDQFTKKYYFTLHGIDNLKPIERPKEEEPIKITPLRERKLPPWNGYGSFQDSAQNCLTVCPKSEMRNVKQFLELDRYGFDSHILRFKAVLQLVAALNRKFIISFYLCDDTISVYEIKGKIGKGSTFLARTKIKLPGQEIYVSEEYDYFKAYHLYVGATVNFNGFIFILTDADEYALRYMELNCEKFPKSNIKLIMEKVRNKIKPIYVEFVAKSSEKDPALLPYEELRSKLLSLMGEDLTEHEILTIARHYSAVCKEERHSREYIRSLVQLEIRKKIWPNFERLKECFKHYDINRTGFLSPEKMYSLLKACKLPLDINLINSMLAVLKKNDKCEIEGKELFDFLDDSIKSPVVTPINQVHELWWTTEKEGIPAKIMNWCNFIKGLDISVQKVQTT